MTLNWPVGPHFMWDMTVKWARNKGKRKEMKTKQSNRRDSHSLDRTFSCSYFYLFVLLAGWRYSRTKSKGQGTRKRDRLCIRFFLVCSKKTRCLCGAHIAPQYVRLKEECCHVQLWLLCGATVWVCARRSIGERKKFACPLASQSAVYRHDGLAATTVDWRTHSHLIRRGRQHSFLFVSFLLHSSLHFNQPILLLLFLS